MRARTVPPQLAWPSALIDLVLGGSTAIAIALVARNLP
jgi:hypothetical protein